MKNLAIYTCAGYPKKDSLLEILPALQESGVKYVEVGIPYSDPIADGPLLQEVHKTALENGISIAQIFDQLKQVQKAPELLIMCYFNSFLQYGAEKFLKSCQEAGVKSLIIPDLPEDYFLAHYQSLFEQYQIGIVFLIAPSSSKERVQELAKLSSPFLYALSSSSTTGSKQLNDENPYEAIQLKELDCPVYIGFNIRSAEDLKRANQSADGGIIGTAFAQAINQENGLKEATSKFIKDLAL